MAEPVKTHAICPECECAVKVALGPGAVFPPHDHQKGSTTRYSADTRCSGTGWLIEQQDLDRFHRR